MEMNTQNDMRRNISPLYILMWLFATLGIIQSCSFIVHLVNRLSKLDGFDEATSRWLSGSESVDDFHWRQYKLDLIERVFIYFSFAAIPIAMVTLLIMCIFKSKKAVIIWAVSAPVSIIVFTLTQGELFDCFSGRNMRKALIIAILYLFAVSCALVIYSFLNIKYLGVALFIAVIFLSCGFIHSIGQLSIHSEESIGWVFAGIFMMLVMFCIKHLRKQDQQENEQAAVNGSQPGSPV